MQNRNLPKKKIISDDIKALLVRAWAAGAIYFFVMMGTTIAEEGTTALTIIIYLSIVHLFVDMILVNPVVYHMFNTKLHGPKSKNYFEKPLLVRVFGHIANLFKNILIVFMVYMAYEVVNSVLVKLLDKPENHIVIKTEAFGYAISYVSFFVLLTWLFYIIKKIQIKRKERKL